MTLIFKTNKFIKSSPATVQPVPQIVRFTRWSGSPDGPVHRMVRFTGWHIKSKSSNLTITIRGNNPVDILRRILQRSCDMSLLGTWYVFFVLTDTAMPFTTWTEPAEHRYIDEILHFSKLRETKIFSMNMESGRWPHLNSEG